MDVPKSKDDPGNTSSTIFSQLRSLSTSLFNSTTSASASSSSSHKSFGTESWNNHEQQPQVPGPLDVKGGSMDDVPTPTPTRPSSPQRRFPGVKSIFTNLASRGSRNSQSVRISVVQTQVQTEGPSAMEDGGDRTPHHEPLASPLGSEFTTSSELSASGSCSSSEFQQLSAFGSYGSSELDETPPLTPESLVADIALLSPASVNAELGYGYEYNGPRIEDGREEEYMDMQVDDSDAQYTSLRPHSTEIKEGKKPERPIDFDALLADISSDADSPDALLSSGDSEANVSADVTDDKDEWYGLEYTLELSTRERRASGTHSFSPGEHSKSRESWAAIHEGSIHPFFEDEEYYQWKNWHRYLDRQDEKRKHRRGRAFKAHAKELAWFYADEMHTRDMMAWQMEVYGEAEKDVFERLHLLEAHRPDPYHPPQKHNVGWYLKRSRSVASLRELRTLPEPILPKSRAFNKI
ncbi:hypothetical protein DFH07DRAFT_813353 [Mycena maculata]|uniref:Uncharacterized protein n=1 Tax=Mycena maculata TaxID=230809 RepID=A0AAD7NHS2_9AGAR|nr:hypothetical protein DFH07DRAFT_813353 [Mycena maculata]